MLETAGCEQCSSPTERRAGALVNRYFLAARLRRHREDRARGLTASSRRQSRRRPRRRGSTGDAGTSAIG
jgi:hypothetical protein